MLWGGGGGNKHGYFKTLVDFIAHHIQITKQDTELTQLSQERNINKKLHQK